VAGLGPAIHEKPGGSVTSSRGCPAQGRTQTNGGVIMVTLELMKAISAAFNSRDVDRIVSFFAEDGVFCLARGPETVGRTLAGKAVIRKALADRFSVIPDMRWENEQYILAPEANRAISVWTVRGKGSDGEDLNYQGCDIYTFNKDDKIAHKNTFWKQVEHRDRL
jgi:ketosteroid isomerase-like protein